MQGYIEIKDEEKKTVCISKETWKRMVMYKMDYDLKKFEDVIKAILDKEGY